MPSFDLVSTMNIGELKNAIVMAQKQINARYDFKGSDCKINLKNDSEMEILAESEYQVQAALEILYSNMGKRNLALQGLEPQKITPTGRQMQKLVIIIHAGIDKEKAGIINKAIKASSLKVSSQYLDEKIRVTSKKIDDLQGIFKELRENKNVTIPLAMENMK